MFTFLVAWGLRGAIGYLQGCARLPSPQLKPGCLRALRGAARGRLGGIESRPAWGVKSASTSCHDAQDIRHALAIASRAWGLAGGWILQRAGPVISMRQGRSVAREGLAIEQLRPAAQRCGSGERMWRMSRYFLRAWALSCYALFLVTFLYLVAFVADAGFIPGSIDRGPASPPAVALPVELALLLIFALQHSVMARRAFKRWLLHALPAAMERSSYVLMSCVVLWLLFACWRPLPSPVWTVRSSVLVLLVLAVLAVAWGIVLLSSFLIDHFELFGLRQAFSRADEAAPPAAQPLREPLFYRLVRHPIYSGFLLAFWAAPVMSQGHLLFAAFMSIYVLVAIRLEERDLVAAFGAGYLDYRRRVGMLLPRWSLRWRSR